MIAWIGWLFSCIGTCVVVALTVLWWQHVQQPAPAASSPESNEKYVDDLIEQQLTRSVPNVSASGKAGVEASGVAPAESQPDEADESALATTISGGTDPGTASTATAACTAGTAPSTSTADTAPSTGTEAPSSKSQADPRMSVSSEAQGLVMCSMGSTVSRRDEVFDDDADFGLSSEQCVGRPTQRKITERHSVTSQVSVNYDDYGLHAKDDVLTARRMTSQHWDGPDEADDDDYGLTNKHSFIEPQARRMTHTVVNETVEDAEEDMEHEYGISDEQIRKTVASNSSVQQACADAAAEAQEDARAEDSDEGMPVCLS